MQQIGLEWLHRLLSEPARLWQRYLFGNTMFLAHLALRLLSSRNERSWKSIRSTLRSVRIESSQSGWQLRRLRASKYPKRFIEVLAVNSWLDLTHTTRQPVLRRVAIDYEWCMTLCAVPCFERPGGLDLNTVNF